MKILRPLFAAFGVVALLGGQATADELTFVEEIPTGIIFGTMDATGMPSENPQGSASSQGSFGFRNADADGEEGTRTRGQSFTFAPGDGLTHDIGSLSVSLNTPLNNGFRPDGQLQLTIFEWDSNDPDNFTNWDLSTGGVFATGHTEIYNETFPIVGADFEGLGTINQFLAQISFDAGKLQLTDGTTYGFIFRYTLDELVDDNGDPLSADVSFAFDVRQDAELPGALLSTNPSTDFAAADNAQSTSRDMNFFFAEPSEDCMLGDVNQDGDVNFSDIAPFIMILATNANQCEADVDVSGMVDFRDIAPFIMLLSGG